MERFKGIIALDIDGTITVDKHRLEKKVNDFLNQLIESGWLLIFITGRTFSFAHPVLSNLKNTYYFAVQNGAALYQMPHEHLIQKHYLPTSLIPKLEEVHAKILIESGRGNQDICYYKPASYTPEELDYINFRIQISPEKWVAVESFEELKIKEFSVVKYFATESAAQKIAEKMRALGGVNVIVISDPFNPGYNLALVNEGGASKGLILEAFRKMYSPELPVIAAGDDFNDVEMLEKSTFKIVMQNAPKTMHALADIVARPAEEHGIIEALKEATKLWKE